MHVRNKTKVHYPHRTKSFDGKTWLLTLHPKILVIVRKVFWKTKRSLAQRYELLFEKTQRYFQVKFDDLIGTFCSILAKKEDTESRKKTKKFTQDTRILTYGARPTVNNDIIEWASDVQFQPLPVEYDIISIDNVFNEYNYEKTFSLEKRRFVG